VEEYLSQRSTPPSRTSTPTSRASTPRRRGGATRGQSWAITASQVEREETEAQADAYFTAVDLAARPRGLLSQPARRPPGRGTSMAALATRATVLPSPRGRGYGTRPAPAIGMGFDPSAW